MVDPGATVKAESTRRYPLDLPTALRLAHAQNPQILFARERIAEATARMDQARALLLPTLSVGASFNQHEGPLQETGGSVTEVSRNAGYAGLGAGAVGAGTVSVPGVSVSSDLADAIFLPLAARQGLRAAEAESRAATNNVLLRAAIGYFELIRAKAGLAIAEESLRNAEDLARLTEDYSRAGEGLASDAERAAVERSLRGKDVEEAREALKVRSLELAELLRLDPLVDLDPLDAIVPLILVAEDRQFEELVRTAQEGRPEVEQSQALVNQADENWSLAKYGPLFPNLRLGFSAGAFGGGPGGGLGGDDVRSDFDAMVFWELRNLGLGDLARARERRAQYHEALETRTSVLDRVASEVGRAQARITSRRKKITLAEEAVTRALRSFELNRARIRGKQGLPIEALQAIQSLALARNEYLGAVIEYDEAQFQLYTALGQPPSEAAPQATLPLSTPVVPPAR